MPMNDRRGFDGNVAPAWGWRPYLPCRRAEWLPDSGSWSCPRTGSSGCSRCVPCAEPPFSQPRACLRNAEWDAERALPDEASPCTAAPLCGAFLFLLSLFLPGLSQWCGRAVQGTPPICRRHGRGTVKTCGSRIAFSLKQRRADGSFSLFYWAFIY